MSLSVEAATRKDISSGLGEMQHRHFATVAAIIAEMGNDDGTREYAAIHFADRLSRTNVRFDRKRFLRACKISA